MVCAQDSFWWCIVTFTTVGYGDKYPRTTAGRFVCAVTMFCGIFFLAMPLTIVGSSFSDAWDKLQTRKLKMAAHDKLAAKEWTPDYEKVRRAPPISRHFAVYTQNCHKKTGPFSVARLKMDVPFHDRFAFTGGRVPAL